MKVSATQVLIESIDNVLTEKQVTIAVCSKDNFEDFGGRDIYPQLARLMSEEIGKNENAMTIKTAGSKPL